MPSTTVYNLTGEVVQELELSELVFGVTPNMSVLHQVVTAQLVNRRQGNASTKTRAEVSGGGKKPYKQKGTGRARQGSTRSPQFRHGGVVFGPKPHPYHHDVPKKMRRLAIRSALSDKVANDKLVVVNGLTLESPRTKDMLSILDKLPVSGKRVLVMLPHRDENVVLSTRNIPTARVQHVCAINVVELLKHDCLVMPMATVRWLEMVFGEGLSADEATSRLALAESSLSALDASPEVISNDSDELATSDVATPDDVETSDVATPDDVETSDVATPDDVETSDVATPDDVADQA